MPAPRTKQHSSLVDHLNAQAPTKAVNILLSLQKYYASADLLLRQATLYRNNKNEEQLYVMLMRFASLMIETIPAHKDFSKGDPRYVQLRKALNVSVSELESIKLSLKTRETPEPIAQSRNRPSDVVRLSTSNLPQLNWAAVSASQPPPPPPVNVDDLLDILSSGPSGRAPAPSAPSATEQRMVPASAPGYQPKYISSSREAENRHALFFNSSTAGRHAQPAPSHYGVPGNAALRYPSLDVLVSTSGGAAYSAVPPPPPPLDDLAANQLMLQQMQLAPSAGPPLGPQEMEVLSMSAHQHPGATGTCSDPCPPAPGPAPSEAPLSSSGPKELMKRAQLRDVHVSVGLMEEFLRFAASNTSRGIETCGILAARLSANDSTFSISTLIIPKQKGTTDTVEMLSEEDVLMVHLEKELYPLGWIHTHPTQTCFLSSVDVHTQCSYQTMLDEAVAIVMAPRDSAKKCGIFRLTTPGGLSLIQKCDRRGFHMHPETSTRQELYELCGHVYLNDRVQHEVVDLR